MKFLLFIVSIIFSIIFYIFHNLTIWKDIFLNNISNTVNLLSFTSNLLFESFIFVLISIFFLYLFSDFKYKWINKLNTYKIEISYFIFYIYFLFNIYFFDNWIDYKALIIIITFILSDLLFNHISNIKLLINNHKYIRYLWLFINYTSSLLSVLYIIFISFNFIIILILIFNIVFNFLLHKKYVNYISLINSILIILFLFYYLYNFIFELYIKYI